MTLSVGDKVRLKNPLPEQSLWTHLATKLSYWLVKAQQLPNYATIVWDCAEIHTGQLMRLTTDDAQVPYPQVLWAHESWVEPNLQPGGYHFLNYNWVIPSIDYTRVGPAEVAVITDREYDGFCTPCGGLRHHKLGCPAKKAGK